MLNIAMPPAPHSRWPLRLALAAAACCLAASSATPKAVWVLVENNVTKRVDPVWQIKPDNAFKLDATASAATLTHTITRRDLPGGKQVTSTRHSWTALPHTLVPKEKLKVTITIAGSHTNNNASSVCASTSLDAFVGSRAYMHKFGGACADIDVGRPKQSESATCELDIPTGQTGRAMRIDIEAHQGPLFAGVKTIYEYRIGPAGRDKPKPNEVARKAEEPKPAPPTDDEPPITPPKPTPAPDPGYYTHPSGDYHIPLPKGWGVKTKHLLDDDDLEYDTLWPTKPDKALVCGRRRRDMGRQKADDVLGAFALRMAKDSPGVRSKPYAVGRAPAVLVADFDDESNVMTWHVLAAHKGHTYYMSIRMSAKSANAPVPEAIATMLAKTEFLR